MKNRDRNKPCACGSGKKIKKCCGTKSPASHFEEETLWKGIVVHSQELTDALNIGQWYHGTDVTFNDWRFPPPHIDPLAVPHKGIFLTTNRSFAEGAGDKLALVSLSGKARVLDMTANYEASERLRQVMLSNQVFKLTRNAQHDNWHKGWKTGEVLRVQYSSKEFSSHLEGTVMRYATMYNMSIEVAKIAVLHNVTRGLIETICDNARKMGFDAIYGYEIDRHSNSAKEQSQPWLAVLNSGFLTKPRWL